MIDIDENFADVSNATFSTRKTYVVYVFRFY